MNKTIVCNAIAILTLFFSGEMAKCETPLTGNETKLEDATKDSEEIFTGKIVNAGVRVLTSITVDSYAGMQVSVLQVFKGHFSQASTISVDLVARREKSEEIPTKDISYLFFTKKGGENRNKVLKLLLTDDALLLKLKKVLDAQPSTQILP